MFKIITNLFSSSWDNSQKTYAYRKKPSAIDQLGWALISTIFKNISLFYKARKDSRKFPEDYVNDLLDLHKNNDSAKEESTSDLMQDLAKPITSLLKLKEMKKEWLCSEKEFGSNDFDAIYYITTTEQREGDTKLEALVPEYDENVFQKYKAQNKKLPSPYHPYKLDLRYLLQKPEGLKNLILMFGLEYNVITKVGIVALGPDLYAPSGKRDISNLNSATKFFAFNQSTGYLIKIPLIHLAVHQGILPKVSFLLTKDNVNCKSYQGISLSNYINDNEYSKQLSCAHTLIILDTPLKIAIDNYDNAAVDILLQNQAKFDISIRPKLTYPNSNRIKSYIKLSDYFLTKTPQPGHQTTAYIEMAKSIYNNLPEPEQDAFTEAAEKKMITVDAEGESLTNEPQPLYNFIRSPNTKSARKASETWTHNKANADNITADMNSYYAKNTLPDTTEDMPYESHINLAGYHAFSALNHLTIEYY